MFFQILIQVCRSRFLCSLHDKTDVDRQIIMVLHVFSQSTQTSCDMTLVVINPTPIHEAIADRKRKGILCPDLIPIRWHSVIVVIENQGLGIWARTLKMRHDKGSRISLINLHFSPNTLENLTQIVGNFFETHLLGKD